MPGYLRDLTNRRISTPYTFSGYVWEDMYEWARPDSIGDIAFIAAIELVALWLYRITKRYREGAVHNGPF